MKKILMTSLLLVSASAWAGCGVETGKLKQASMTVNGKTTALRCGKSGKVYRQLDDFYAACHIDKRHADWVAYQKADGTAARGTGCHIVKNKGWACNRWQDVDAVNIQSKSELGCNDRDYDESSVVR